MVWSQKCLHVAFLYNTVFQGHYLKDSQSAQIAFLELKKSTPAALRASADVLVAQAQSRVTKMHPGSALEHLQKLAASPRSRFTFASTPDGHQMRNCILILKSSFLRKELASLHDKLTTFMLVDPLLVGSL